MASQVAAFSVAGAAKPVAARAHRAGAQSVALKPVAPGVRALNAAASKQAAVSGRGAALRVQATDGGFLKFPQQYNLESYREKTGIKEKKIVFMCPYGPGEQILAFKAIAALKAKYPVSFIDVVCAAEANSAYLLNSNVRKTFNYDVNGDPYPDEYTDFLGIMKGQGYDMAVTAVPAGASWAMGMGNMVPQGEKLGYTKANPYAIDFAAKMIVKGCPAPKNMEDLGVSMFDDLIETCLGSSNAAVKVEVPEGASSWAVEALGKAGVAPGFTLVHAGEALKMWAGCKTFSPAAWGKLAKPGILIVADDEGGLPAGVAGAKGIVCTDVAKMAALVQLSGKVVAPNTAAAQIAQAMGKPIVAVMDADTAAAFCPGAEVVAAPEEISSLQMAPVN